MNKYFYVLRAASFHFKNAFKTLYDGFKDPQKFYEDDKRNNEIMAKVFPMAVMMNLIHK